MGYAFTKEQRLRLNEWSNRNEVIRNVFQSTKIVWPMPIIPAEQIKFITVLFDDGPMESWAIDLLLWPLHKIYEVLGEIDAFIHDETDLIEQNRYFIKRELVQTADPKTLEVVEHKLEIIYEVG